MDRQFAVAVVGATGLVGEMMIRVLEERGFPVSQLFPLASNRSLGHSVSFRGRSCAVNELEGFDFAQCDFALFSAGAAVSREHAPRAAAAGCIVIDNTSEFRYQDSVPLVVPEVNPQALAGVGKSGIVANPNCSTIQLVVALKPLHDEAHLERVEVATYQSVSGAGREAVEELARQSIAALSGKGAPQTHGGSKPIAFNCVPHIDAFQDNGYTREEMKIVWETRKILAEPGLTEDLASLPHDLHLLAGVAVLLEGVDVGYAVEGDRLRSAVRGRRAFAAQCGDRLAGELFHRFTAGARN